MNTQCAFSSVKTGLSLGDPPSDAGCVWSLSESVCEVWVVSACVGVSVVEFGGCAPSLLEFLCEVATASYSATARSLGT